MDSKTILASAKQYMAEETDPSFAKEVEELIAKNDEKELFDRFYRQLEFGTGGILRLLKRRPKGSPTILLKPFPKRQRKVN